MGLLQRRQLEWMGRSKQDLAELPHEPKQRITYAIFLAEQGKRHPDVKPLKGIAAEEVVCDYSTNTFRGVYTISLSGWVYVLHCFMKKSKRGRKTPKPDLDLIKSRLKDAEALHAREGRNQTRAE